MARIRRRVSGLTEGLPRRARDTVGWDTPARWAMSREVALARVVIGTGSFEPATALQRADMMPWGPPYCARRPGCDRIGASPPAGCRRAPVQGGPRRTPAERAT